MSLYCYECAVLFPRAHPTYVVLHKLWIDATAFKATNCWKKPLFESSRTFFEKILQLFYTGW